MGETVEDCSGKVGFLCNSKRNVGLAWIELDIWDDWDHCKYKQVVVTFYIVLDFDHHLGVDVRAADHPAKLLKADLAVVVLENL